MAFRREGFDKEGGFRTDLGRSSHNIISNEDTEFGRRVMAAGFRLRYEPSALTRHPIQNSRLRKAYFLTWWFNKGRSDFRELGYQPYSKRVSGVPLRLIRTLVGETVRWMSSLEEAQRFGHKLQVWVTAGQIFESYVQRLNSKRDREHCANGQPPMKRA